MRLSLPIPVGHDAPLLWLQRQPFTGVLPLQEAQNLSVPWLPTLGHPWITSRLCSCLCPHRQSGVCQLWEPMDMHTNEHHRWAGDHSIGHAPHTLDGLPQCYNFWVAQNHAETAQHHPWWSCWHGEDPASTVSVALCQWSSLLNSCVLRTIGLRQGG